MSAVDPMAAIRQTFFQECEEGLADLETGLMQMEAGGADHEMVNAVFRAVHSIKGGAGAFGLDALVRFAHVFETTMDEIRSDRLAASPDVVAVLLRANDVLADLVINARDGGEMDDGHVAAVVTELKAASGAPEEEPEDDDGMGDFDFTPVAFGAPPPVAADPELETPAAGSSGFTIRFAPSAALYAKANDTTLLLRELSALGDLTAVMDDGRLPSLDELDAEEAYLSWTISLVTDAPESAVREVFEFVEDDCALQISALGAEPEADTAPEPESSEPVAAASAPAGGEVDIMALLAMARAASDPELAAREAAAEAEAQIATENAPLAPVITLPTAAVPQVVPGPAAPAAPATAAGAAPATAGGTASIRVDLDRVDRLIDLVGELVINQAMLSQRVTEAGLPRSSAAGMALDELEHLTRDIQDSVMAIRAQPVKSVFQRMPRLVREVAAMTGKQVRLVTEGENTEVDKTVIERLSDPLTHMIRNAIDHGLESTEKRLAAGKPAEGVVKLCALHRSGRIVLEVSDDGGGINRPRVRQIAIDKGLIEPEAQLTDEETDNLIFLPGFSTAEVISDVSGRGVGMDVVRRSIQALGGRISITSRPGLGSTFTLSLPLTLAVLDGMVVTIAGQTLVAPLTAIVETLRPKASQIHALGDGCVISIRDSYLPLIDVGAALGYRAAGPAPTDCVALLVETESGGRAALMVDEIQGQRQVVIKSLEANFQHVVGVAAATILGDGRVALILDVDAVVAQGVAVDSRAADPEPLPLKLAAAG